MGKVKRAIILTLSSFSRYSQSRKKCGGTKGGNHYCAQQLPLKAVKKNEVVKSAIPELYSTAGYIGYGFTVLGPLILHCPFQDEIGAKSFNDTIVFS